LSQIRNDGLTNLNSNLCFYFLANRFNDFILKGLIDLHFVVIYGNVWLFQMLDVPQHLKRII
jgi:hypothetical protein